MPRSPWQASFFSGGVPAGHQGDEGPPVPAPTCRWVVSVKWRRGPARQSHRELQQDNDATELQTADSGCFSDVF